MVATLTLLQDLTANAALLTLLTGPRWAIGPRDLALLGRRAARAGRAARPRAAPAPTSGAELAAAVDGRRPDRDRLARRRARRPGRPAPTRRRRGSGSRCSPPSCAGCASRVGEPLLDLVRRIIDTTGIDVELASSVSPAARGPARQPRPVREGGRRVPGRRRRRSPWPRCWPGSRPRTSSARASTWPRPTEADSVKLLTVHRAKGLEWDAVFLVGVARHEVPDQPRPLTLDRPCPSVLPAALRGDARDLPAAAAATTPADIDARTPRRPRSTTRSRSSGSATSPAPAPGTCCRSRRYCWKPSRQDAARPVGVPACASARRWRRGARQPDAVAGQAGEGRRPTRYAAAGTERPWPMSAPHRGGRAAAARPPSWSRRRSPRRRPTTTIERHARPGGRRSRQWDDELERLLAEARRDRRQTVDVPAAVEPVRDRAGPAARRPGGVRPRPGPADAAAAVAGGPVRHPVPRLGRGPVRPAATCSTPTSCPAAATPASTTTPTCAS